MSNVLVVFVVLGLILTLGVLFFGLITMARGGEFHSRNSNKLMRWRVILQAVTIGLFILLILSSGK